MKGDLGRDERSGDERSRKQGRRSRGGKIKKWEEVNKMKWPGKRRHKGVEGGGGGAHGNAGHRMASASTDAATAVLTGSFQQSGGLQVFSFMRRDPSLCSMPRLWVVKRLSGVNTDASSSPSAKQLLGFTGTSSITERPFRLA